MRRFLSVIGRWAAVLLLVGGGIWLAVHAVAPSAESPGRQAAVGSLAPGGGPAAASVDAGVGETTGEAIGPVAVNMAEVPASVYDPDNQLDRWRRGEIDLDERDGIRGEAELAAMRAASMKLPASPRAQLAASGLGLSAPTPGTKFASLDFTECCGGSGGSVPPDPQLAVGPNHAIAVVNVALEIYDKSGTSLVGPVTFSSFFSATGVCTKLFDPNVLYDEEADRYFLGIDSDGSRYCLAVSQTNDPTGSWWLYSIVTGSDFFDYPHVGVGREAIFMGANMFNSLTGNFSHARVWAFNKADMYSGQPLIPVTKSLGASEDTPQPLNLHGYAQGTWPDDGPHYFLTSTNFNGGTYSLYAWTDPFGTNLMSKKNFFNLITATGVSAGMPVDTPQMGGSNVQANDFRPQDLEYRNGYGWTTMTIACNPGSGTVNCVRWAQIDLAAGTLVDAGVYASNGTYRIFSDLAVNPCNDMVLGYTKSSTSMFPSVWVTGRQSGDAAGTLQAEVELKAGEIAYTSFESTPPRRWGDYTELTVDPSGTFWYLGEYSKNTGTSSGRWGTYIGSFSYPCNVAPLQVDAGSDQTVDEGDTVSFSGSHNSPSQALQGPTAPDNTISWEFGDGAHASGSLTPTHVYADNGVYLVTLAVTNTYGASASDMMTVTVNNVAPLVQAGPDMTAVVNQPVQFNGQFTDPGTADSHTIDWEFGDGNGTNGVLTPTHVYTSAGIYTVTLTVVDDDLGSGSDTLQVEVRPNRVFIPFAMRQN